MADHRHDHSGWRPVPVLPYLDAMATTAFWTALGSRVSDGSPDGTPYLLAVREGAELHFRSLPEVKPWGLREMTVVDPAGTLVRLAESA